MTDPQREKFLAEIERYRTAIKQTKSPYLKRDYNKALSRMLKELKAYDRYHKYGC